MSFLCKNKDDKAQSLRQKKFFILEKTNKLGTADHEDAKNVSLVFQPWACHVSLPV